MDSAPAPATDEAESLRRCLNDLASITALSTTWAGAPPSRIIATLLDALVGMLDAAFIVLRWCAPDGGRAREMARVGRVWEDTVRSDIARELGEALGDVWSNCPPVTWLSLGGTQLRVVCTGLGLQADLGNLIVGSERADFPSETERLIVTVAASQAALGLQQGPLIVDRIRASEHNLKLIIDTIPALAWSARPDGSAEFFNQHYLDFIGFTEEQASGWGWVAAVHADDLDTLIAAWQRIMAAEAPGEAEARLRRNDGHYRWFLLRANPLRDESGASSAGTESTPTSRTENGQKWS